MSVGDNIDFQHILGSDHQMATEISNLWTEWDSARAEWKSRVRETKSYVFATSTRETTNDKNLWSHSTNIPQITQIYDNLKSNYIDGMFPNNDWLKFEGDDTASVYKQKRMVVEAYLKTKHRLSDFRNVAEKLIDDWILTGNCFAAVDYVAETFNDPDTGLPTNGYQGPVVRRIDPNDIVCNILASDFARAGKIIRSIKTLGEVTRDIEENPALGYEQDVFNQILNIRQEFGKFSSEDIDKSIQITYDGFGTFGQYIKSGYIEFLDFYGDFYDKETGIFYKNHAITVVDRKWVIRNEPLNTWTGRPHIYHSDWRGRPDNIWGQGPLDNLTGMQYRLNHLENARADAFDQMISPDIVYKGDVQEFPGPGGSLIYEVNESGDVTYLRPDATVLNADFQIKQLEDKMELYAGAPREAMGIRTPGEKTKFEVQSLSNAAGRIFQNKMTRFEVNMLEPIVNAEVEVARRNLNYTDVIKIIDDDDGVIEFMTITKDDITANGRLIPIGARHYAKQARLAQDLAQFQQIAMTDPMVMQHFPSVKLAEIWEGAMGFDKFGLLKPYARIMEQGEAAQLSQIVQQNLQEDQMTAADAAGAGLPPQTPEEEVPV